MAFRIVIDLAEIQNSEKSEPTQLVKSTKLNPNLFLILILLLNEKVWKCAFFLQ